MRVAQIWTAFLLAMVVIGIAPARAADKPEETEERARLEAMLQAGRSGLCRVHYYFKRPEDEVPGGYDMFSAMSQLSEFQYDAFIDKQKSLLTSGVLLDDEGHVLVGDLHLEGKYIDRIEVVAPDGTRYAAERDRLLDRAPAAILRIAGPLQGWEPPEYVLRERITEPGSAFVVSLSQMGRRWWLSRSEVGEGYAYTGTGAEPDVIGGQLNTQALRGMLPGVSYDPYAMWRGTNLSEMSAAASEPALLCNEEGQPIGAMVPTWPLDPLQEASDWQHQRLLNGPAFTFEWLDQFVESCREQFGEKMHKCRILYRQEGEESGGMGMMSRIMSTMGQRMVGGDEKEWVTYGLAVEPTRLLVPLPISREQAARIESIELTVGGETRAGEFAGAFKDLGAFLVDLTEGKFPATAVVRQADRPERIRLFFTASASEKFGKKHLEVRPNRWLAEGRGYRDEYHVSPVHTVRRGTWILDEELNVVGLYARQRIEGEELSQLGQDMMLRYAMGEMGGEARVFWSGEVAHVLGDPVAHYDPQIRHKTREEAKRIAWLGVEFTPLNRELAKQLEVEKQTKDGKIGLYVNRVYAGSPAGGMGIAPGDILLRIDTRKRPHPVELNMSEYGASSFRFDWTQYMDYQYMEEYGGTQPKWPPRLNYLTMLLQTIGEGEDVTLTYLHEGQEISEDFTIELAPRDFASAEKYKNKEIGITVKDVTYEVRAALRLPDEKPAVVVAKVEPGSPTEVAKIRPFELITAIDGAAVGSADQFEERIEAALEQDEPSVRLTVEYLGKSRLADLELTQAEAAESGEGGE